METKSQILREFKKQVYKYDHLLRIVLAPNKRTIFISRGEYPLVEVSRNCFRAGARYPFSFELLKLIMDVSDKLLQEDK